MRINSTSQLIQIGLAIMSLTCLLDMPYGYFQLYRWVGLGVFIYLALHEEESSGWRLFWIVSAIGIQPIFKITLGREIWNFVDLVWAAILGYSAIKRN
jgi:hypothetical protein